MNKIQKITQNALRINNFKLQDANQYAKISYFCKLIHNLKKKL